MDSRVNDHFAACSRDLTPASAGNEVCVLFAPVSHVSEVSRHCESVLSDTELLRADRFVSEFDRAQFIQRRAFRRFLAATVLGLPQPLSQIVFTETANGRPYLAALPEFWFSFSSCRFGILGAWSSTFGIGVDLEDQMKNPEATDLAHRFFSPAEAHAVEAAGGADHFQTFFRFWSLKEAALKSIGEGLPFGLDAFEFDLSPRLRVIHAPPDHGGPAQFNAHVIEGTGSCAALVIRNLAR